MNITALSNLTPLTLNYNNITNASTLVPQLITTANDVTQGYYGLGIMIAIFLVMLYTLFRDDGDNRMDITRTLMVSSGIVSIIGVIMLVTGFITSFVHVMWFIAIFMLTLVGTLLQKQKGY
jgi:hypothetical protein